MRREEQILYTQQDGRGGKTILLLPGLLGTGRYYDALFYN